MNVSLKSICFAILFSFFCYNFVIARPRQQESSWLQWTVSLPTKAITYVKQHKLAAGIVVAAVFACLLPGAGAADAEVAFDGAQQLASLCPPGTYFIPDENICTCIKVGFWDWCDAILNYLPDISIADLDDIESLARRFVDSEFGRNVFAIMSPEKAAQAFKALVEINGDIFKEDSSSVCRALNAQYQS